MTMEGLGGERRVGGSGYSHTKPKLNRRRIDADNQKGMQAQ